MDHQTMNEVNEYLVMIFNEVLSIEEEAISRSEFSDLSVKEMHTIEAIGLSGDLNSAQVAKCLDITPGTLTVSIQNLVKKGYVTRVKSETDRRVVKLALTKRGKLIYRLHHKFHMRMVEESLTGFDPEEAQVLIRGLRNLHEFLNDLKNQQRKE
ncbi:MarR family winged helix-turn-helix transcriptional regulator [Dolosigranulum pigrum]|uniref:fatty acid biosynthesis transcriptional regulator FabT n=1 Tax=Dolosigranulum pigrum TaxID=29394 RepID=UPI001AD8906E|nr:MarR family transcriptional regulator [Dolosigranulum pigrum]QTJ32226.1 MarR family transcriptional regulator [Dolosigranulum pigrum]